MTYKQFDKAIIELKIFINNFDKITKPLECNTPEWVGFFIDQYINLIEIAMNDKYEWVSWYVFENDFGNKNMQATIKGVEVKTKTTKQMYDVIKKHNQC